MYVRSLQLLKTAAETVIILRTTTVEWSSFKMEDCRSNLLKTKRLLRVATEKIERAMALSRNNLIGTYC